MAQSKPGAGTGGKCPICGAPTEHNYRPFCSRRCADVDLSRWLRGAYAIPGDEDDEDGENRSPSASPDTDDTADRPRGPRKHS